MCIFPPRPLSVPVFDSLSLSLSSQRWTRLRLGIIAQVILTSRGIRTGPKRKTGWWRTSVQRQMWLTRSSVTHAWRFLKRTQSISDRWHVNKTITKKMINALINCKAFDKKESHVRVRVNSTLDLIYIIKNHCDELNIHVNIWIIVIHTIVRYN